MWYDTFDYATRVEYLGIGVYGNRVRAVIVLLIWITMWLHLRLVSWGRGLRTWRRRVGKSGGRVEAAKIITELCFED